MTNPAINAVLEKMNEVQEEFFKIKDQVKDKDSDFASDEPDLYMNIVTKFSKGYEKMADAVALLAYNDIKNETRLL